MDQRALDALKGSIAKWEAIVAGTGADEGIRNCPLCTQYWHNGCVGCPVSELTGYESCDKTPYEAWSDDEDWFSGIKADTPERVGRAKMMLNFLKGLLPEEAP